MMRILRSAWHLIVKRAAADWVILSGALVTVMLATVLLAAGPIYANAVTLSGAQRTLADAAVSEANILILLRTPPGGVAAAEQLVATEIDRATSPIGAEIVRRYSTESFQLPEQDADEIVDLAVFRSFDAIERHATLVAGSWPNEADSVAAAVSEATADRLGLELGDELRMANRRDRAFEVDVRIVGVYRIDDAADPYWFDDTIDLEGRELASSFLTHGPFVVSHDVLLSQLAPRTAQLEWRVFPRYELLEVSDLPVLRRAVDRLEDRLNVEVGARESLFAAETGLRSILADTERSLTVTRSGVVMLSIQLSILAGYALVLTAGLLAESRAVETHLLRSRGGARSQVVAMAVMEGVLLTIPAAAVAPWLAGRALTVLTEVGPWSSLDLTIRASATPSAFVFAFLAASGCVIALALPAFRSSRLERGSPRSTRPRRPRLAQRAGVDVALLGLAAAAFWQLDANGVSITSQVRGTLGIDPLLIAAPTLGLAAGALLALRTIPLAAALAERLAARGQATVRALSAWQVSRRPARYARAGLLLVMAIAIGFFAAAYTTTWSQSQDDQAAFQTGADLRVSPNRRTNDSITDLQLRSEHLQVDGLAASMPVVRKTGPLDRASGNAQFVILDAAQAGEIVELRDDLAPEAFAGLMDELVADRPSVASLPLPGEPAQIGLLVSVDPEPLPNIAGVRPWTPAPEQVEQPESPDFRLRPSARLVLQDRFGALHRISLGPIPTDGTATMVGASLTEPVGGSIGLASPAYPLAVVDIEIVSPAPFARPRTAEYRLLGIYTSEVGSSWERLEVPMAPHNWQLGSGSVSGLGSFPSIGPAELQTDGALHLTIDSGQSVGGFRASPIAVSFSIRPAGTQLPSSFPVVVSDRYLEETSTAVGDEVRLSGLRAQVDRAVIVGSVREFPTVDPSLGAAIVLDHPTFQMLNYEVGATIESAGEYWIRSDAGSGTLADELLAAPFESVAVVDRTDRAAALKTDPVALGTTGVLALGFVAAAVFAATGFAVSASVSARERLTEFSLLRALGLSSRQLGSWLTLEQGVLVGASLVIGTLIGVLLAAVILPLIAITQQGANAVPEVIVVYPWAAVAALDAAVVAVVVVIVGVLTATLRRLGLGSLLRLGED